MEGVAENTHETQEEGLRETAKHIADMHIQAAERYLDNGDPLRGRIVDYYVRPETEQELLNVLENKNKGEISVYLTLVKDVTEDPSRFIERMEKLYELQDVHRRRRELAEGHRPATEEEYELGAYADVLESQVRDAVLAAQKKSYLTFQSGFTERGERNQFMDFYNRNIMLPETVLTYLKERSIEVRLENFSDRTTLTLFPTGTDPVRIAEWKVIWDTLIDGLPPADPELVPDMRTSGENADFRRKQDILKGNN